MKLIRIFLGSLAAASTLLLGSCGEKTSSSDKTGSASSEVATSYPLDVCVVSGKKLGSMGAPHVIHHQGTEVRFCCDHCVPKFNADPEAYLSKLKAAQVASATAKQ